ncbi:MAG: MGMT family protein [Gammaproteobacteria bacterium]
MLNAKAKISNRNERVFAVVRQIPEGCVLSYKRVAELAAIPGPSAARQVGYALAQIPDDMDIPWYRVINSKGRLSPRANPDSVEYQRELLSVEGVGFDHEGKIDLEKYAWSGAGRLK